MTDRTHPDSGRATGAAHIIRFALELEWDEVFDCAVAAWCRSSTSQEMLRMCFQSRTQRNEVSVGWTANELMAFATGIARLVASPTPPAEQQAAPKAAPTRTALPEGWTACTIEFCNDGPEEVAYGPKRMMARLAKWLGKYFAQVIAEARTTARATADSVTAPAGPSKSLPYEPTSAMLIAARERDPALPIETVRAIYWSMWRTAPTPPAQAADSAPEDAGGAATAPQPAPAAVAEQEPVVHDEELLEQMYWEFDGQRRRTGEERLAFKGKMRSYASEFRRRSDGKMTFSQSVSDDMMNLADRLGSEYDDVDPRAWKHLLVYAPNESPSAKAAPAPLSEMPYEKRKAIQEGEQIGASDAWFKARHEMLDTLDRRNVFRAGFDRGWNAALAAQGNTP